MPKPVVLLARQRAGTNYLRHLLKQTPLFFDCNEICHTEFYQKKRKQRGTWERYNYLSFRMRSFKKNALLSIPLKQNVEFIFDKYLAFLKQKIPQSRVPILDIKYNSIHHFHPAWQGPLELPYLFDLLIKHEIPMIHLVRENLFNTYVSFEVAHTNQKWALYHHDDYQLRRITVDIHKMLPQLSEMHEELALFRKHIQNRFGKRSIEIKYEEIEHLDSFVKKAKPKIEMLLGLSLPDQFETETVKSVPRAADMIDNFDEVATALKQTEFSGFVNSENR